MQTDEFPGRRDDKLIHDQTSPKFSLDLTPGAHQVHPAKYRCLLRCEGEKTYLHPGFCPDCNSKMVLAAEGGQPDAI